MKSIWHLLIAGGAVVALALGLENRAAADGPMALTDTQLDRVTAGIALLLPAVQSAREAARREHADVAPVVEFRDGNLLLTVQQSAVPNTPAGPKLGLRNLARGFVD